jgi:HEAT repeat protein
MDPVTAGALAELIATAVTSTATHAWTSVGGKPEGRAVKAAISQALSGAMRDSALPVGRPVDDAWIGEVAAVWERAFTPEVSRQLVACIASTPDVSARRFSELARRALVDSGCDLTEFGRTFWVDEFLALLPRRFFKDLRELSLRDPAVRGLVEHVLQQRWDAQAREEEPPTPGEFRQDLIEMLRGLDKQACTGRLPTYLPTNADVTVLSRTVRVRQGLRSSSADRPSSGAALDVVKSVYLLPVERARDSASPRPWSEVAEEHQRLVVLADPGLGKSWLIRTETHRLCLDALARLDIDPESVVIPVPLRCDQLVGAAGQDLADKAAAHLVTRGLLRERSSARVAMKLRAGEAVVLLDALDELTGAQNGALRELVRSWAERAGDRARCVITSRIAGYTGPPVPGTCEVELQGFTPDDAVAAVAAWHLPPSVAERLLDRLRDPATAAMARIPLLLALLCSLTAQLPDGEALPRTRGLLYERVLRWFLTRAHRSQEDPGTEELDDIEIGALLEIAAPLAYAFASQPAGWTDLMPGESLQNAIRAAGAPFTELGRSAAQVLKELSVGAGVLVPEGDPSAGRSPHYLFIHRTMAEYLVARHVATLPDADWLAIVDRHCWFDPDWAEVIPMLGERLSGAGARTLIQHLAAIESDPFHESLLLATRVWGARADADQLLPSALALELTDQLDDLFQHELTRAMAARHCSAMAYLPYPLQTRLVAKLADKNSPEQQEAAVQALADRQAPGVLEALIARLTDSGEYSTIRTAAARALAGRREPHSVEALLDFVADHHEVSWMRSEVLRALGDREDSGVTKALLARLTDLAEKEAVRAAAAWVLADREDPSITKALLDCLTGPDEFMLRAAAVRALADRQAADVTAALLARLTDQNEYPSIRIGALTALAGRVTPGVSAALLACLTDTDPMVRALVPGVLGDSKESGVTEALLAHLADPNVESSNRPAVVQALAGREAPGLTRALLDCLTAPDAKERRQAVESLADRHEQGVTEALLNALDDDDWFVRAGVARALPGRQDPRATEALLTCLIDNDEFVRAAAIEALAELQDPSVTEILLTFLADPGEHVRAVVMEALANRQDQGVTEALLARLADENEDENERVAAIDVLTTRQEASVTEALLKCLDDPSEYLREEAAQALAHRESPEALLNLAGRIQTLSKSSLSQVAPAAHLLMIRHYHRLDPTEQPMVLAAMGWLTTAAEMGHDPDPPPVGPATAI